MTAQVREQLIYQGEEYSIDSCPSIPHNDPRVKQLSGADFIDEQGIFLSTACWRQYIATWEIKDDRLYLCKVEGVYQLVDDTPIFADWFSGEICVPQGELINCNIEADFLLEYEKELFIQVENGLVTQTKLVDYTQ